MFQKQTKNKEHLWSEKFVWCIPTVPTSPVTDIKAVRKTSQSIYLKWTPPSKPNGIITKYTITYTSRAHSADSDRTMTLSADTPNNQSQYNLTRLHPFWMYTITVQAFTVVGQGEVDSEHYKVRTEEAGKTSGSWRYTSYAHWQWVRDIFSSSRVNQK